jgi:hypothetical protein
LAVAVRPVVAVAPTLRYTFRQRLSSQKAR